MIAKRNRWSVLSHWWERLGRGATKPPGEPHPVPRPAAAADAESEGLQARPCGRVSCFPAIPRPDGAAADRP
jgi:hypothetical protein